MTDLRALRPALPILIGASVMLSLAMGLRQSLGLFMPPLTRELGIPVADFTLAIALQNLIWGLLQPLAGAWAVRLGYRPLMVAGSGLYLVGLLLLATAQGLLGVMLGALLAAPLGQSLALAWGWRWGLAGFCVLALMMAPAAWVAGRADALPLPTGGVAGQLTARDALATALRNPVFVVMSLAYFVCGMQLVFLTTHLPSYLDLCGMDAMLGAQALGMIGAFNVLGSLFFGWAGGRWNKLMLLGGIYIVRSLALAWYFSALPTPAMTLAFAGLMGLLWLGVVPLVAGWVADTFDLRWQAMLGGVAFVSHQLGSFVGAFGGGLIFDRLGSYTLAWQAGVALGLAAGIVQVLAAHGRVPRQPPPVRA